ncbi:MAG TPA: glycosyltransferase family 4 protein [Actinoplanes sp.]|nr:glycosyltransferase family 4 protein [Actinoplanes sp.]
MLPALYVVLPAGVDDPAAPSGGNTYDRRVCAGLADAGWTVHELTVGGRWPMPDEAGLAALAEALRGIPDGALVLLDGLVACGVPELVEPAADRLRVVVLVHLPLADETGLTPAEAAALDALERRTLHAAVAVAATSDWAARRLITRHRLPAERVHVAAPGVRPAPVTAGTADGGRLLVVAAVTPRKGHDVLIEALARVADLPWSCVCVGALDRAPQHLSSLRAAAERHAIAGRVTFAGPRTGTDLERSFADADLLVLASRAETYGMVITEALAHGVPVLATAVGGVPEALGHAPGAGQAGAEPAGPGQVGAGQGGGGPAGAGWAGGERPGLLVPPDDPAALAAALRRWLTAPHERQRLRAAALARRAALPDWDATVRDLATILEGVR